MAYCWRPFGMSFGWSPSAMAAGIRIRSLATRLSVPRRGVVALSLWRMDILAGLRLGVGAHGLWFWRARVLPAGDGRLGSQRRHARHCSVAPGDKPGKTAQNLNQGISPCRIRRWRTPLWFAGKEKWSVLKTGPAEAVSTNLAASAPPARVSRTIGRRRRGEPSRDTGPRFLNFVMIAQASLREQRKCAPSSTVLKNTSNPGAEGPTRQWNAAGNNPAVVQGPTSSRIPARPGTPGSPASPQRPCASARVGAPPRAPAVPAPAHSGGSSASGRSFPSGALRGEVAAGSGGPRVSSARSSGHPSFVEWWRRRTPALTRIS